MDPITRDIQQSYQNLAASGDTTALQRYLATTPYSAQQIASATGFNPTDLQSALSRARTAQSNPQQWKAAGTESTLGGMGQHLYGGDPGVSQSYNPSIPYQAAKIGGFRGTLADWQTQQTTNRTQAQKEVQANPNVVAGGYTPQTQAQAVGRGPNGPGLSSATPSSNTAMVDALRQKPIERFQGFGMGVGTTPAGQQAQSVDLGKLGVNKVQGPGGLFQS